MLNQKERGKDDLQTREIQNPTLTAAQLPNRRCRNQALEEDVKDIYSSSQHSPATSVPPSFFELPISITEELEEKKKAKYSCMEYANSSHQIATKALLALVLRMQTVHHFLNNYNSVSSTSDTQKSPHASSFKIMKLA